MELFKIVTIVNYSYIYLDYFIVLISTLLLFLKTFKHLYMYISILKHIWSNLLEITAYFAH